MRTPNVSRRDLLLSAGSFFTVARLLRGQDVTKPDASKQDASKQDAPAAKTDPKSDVKFEAGVKVVNVFASVRNNKGEIVKDLTQSDFTIEEEGRPQTIKYFSRESDLPLTLGLLLDTSGSVRRVLDQEKTATSLFIEQVLREDKDQTFLIHFDAEVELLQDLTSSKKKLENALKDVQVAERPQLQRRDPNSGGGYPSGSGGSSGGGGGRGQHGGTALYDAILLASDELMKKQKGRKALVLLTDGVDHGSKSTLSESIESAQRSDTLVYSIYFAGEEQGSGFTPHFGGPGMGRGGGMGGGGRGRAPQQQQPHMDGKKILERISKETGGAFFEVTKKQPIDKIYDRIEEELRSQYSLGYTPDKDSGPGYRKIHVAVKDKKMVVQARDGYYPSAT